MESRSNFDFKSDLDFPSLSSNVASANSKRNTSPQEKRSQHDNKEVRENSRCMSRGRGKKQNWKAVHVEFSNSQGQRYQPRGTSRPRFGNNHAISKLTDEPYEFSYRGYRNGSRSRIRRGRGGTAPHNFGRPQSAESTTPLQPASPTSDLSPTIMTIPYTPNYTTYVQPLSAAPNVDSTPVNIEEIIRHQIEYYFSEENLIKDNYMRLNMTNEGFLSIQLISNFNKIKQMNVDIETITRAIEFSDKLDVVDRKIVRPVIDPLRWPLSQPLPPSIPNMVKNFAQPDSLISPLQTNSAIYQEAVSELHSGDMIYQNIQSGDLELVAATSVNDMVFQNVEQSLPDPVEHLSGYMQGITFDEKAAYNYQQCYPTDLQEESYQQNSHDESTLTFKEDSAYSYYPNDSHDCQQDVNFQQDEGCLQDVNFQQDESYQEDSQTLNCQKDFQNGDCKDETLKEKVAIGYDSTYLSGTKDINHCQQDLVDIPAKSLKENTTYSYNPCYPIDADDCQQDSIDVIRCQQDSQDVSRYQHMFAYVSS